MTVSPRRFGRWDLAFALCLALLFAALAVRAVAEDRWSDWSIGDALTMLSLRQWEEGGWLANRLLMLPQGYAAPIRHLDDPDLRQHAHGISPGSSPGVGPRLWYTHYPPGYLVPYAAFTRLGLGSMAALRLLSLAFSVAALALMYLVFKRLSSPPVAFLAAVFYALSPAFLGYADALANQPIDDLLRFGFMLAVVLSTRAGAARARRTALLAAWGIEFVLSLSSYDSVFFLYLWLVGWDLLETRRPNWRTWLAFAAAPVSAFGLCFLQNVWYLVWADAARDIVSAFFQKTPAESPGAIVGGGAAAAIGDALLVVARGVVPRLWLLPALAALYALRPLAATVRPGERVPGRGVIALLLVCGASYEIVLPRTAWMPYEARQLVPFVALLAAGLSVALVADLRVLLRRPAAPSPRGRLAVPSLHAAAAAAVLFAFWSFWAQSLRETLARPSNFSVPSDDTSVLIAKELRPLRTQFDAVFFDLDGIGVYLTPDATAGYRQIHPMLEYYAGSRPILAFSERERVAPDLERLARRAPRQFSPVLIGRELQALRSIVTDLGERGLLRRMPAAPRLVRDAYVLDLTEAMNW